VHVGVCLDTLVSSLIGDWCRVCITWSYWAIFYEMNFVLGFFPCHDHHLLLRTHHPLSVALTQINNAFRGGLQLDRDVLLAVLEVNANNVQATIAFLQAGQNDFVEQAPQANGQPQLPKGEERRAFCKNIMFTKDFVDYMAKPKNWVQPKTSQESRDPNSNEFRYEQVKTLILATETTFIEHFVRAATNEYVAILLLLVEQGVELPAPSKAKILAAAWGSNVLFVCLCVLLFAYLKRL
jgi:hypothetical protein